MKPSVRFTFWSATAAMAALSFAACEQDDNIDGNSLPEPTKTPVALTKTVTSITEYYNGEAGYIHEFAHDHTGRVVNYSIYDPNYPDGGSGQTSIDYDTQSITLTYWDGAQAVLNLNDAGAVIFADDSGADYSDHMTFTYSGDCLTNIFQAYSAANGYVSNYEMALKWESGNLVSKTETATAGYPVRSASRVSGPHFTGLMSYAGMRGAADSTSTDAATRTLTADTYTATYTYGTELNQSGNLDVSWIIQTGSNLFDTSAIPGLYGVSSKNLVTAVTYSKEGYPDETYTYSYDLDKDGCVTKIYETFAVPASVTRDSDITSVLLYEITYDK